MIGLVLDIETTSLYRTLNPDTGYLYDSNEILEVGYLRIDMNTTEILGHGVLYFYKPYFQIENKAQEFHKLTRDFLEKYESEFDKNLVILNSLVTQTCIIGKNCDTFDIPYIYFFVDKHSKGTLSLKNVVNSKDIKTYEGGSFYYDPASWSHDVQTLLAPIYRDLYYEKYGTSTSKKGTLEQYIDVLDAYDKVEEIYSKLDKERTTGAHGALYDVVMTYVVWLYLREKNIV